MKSRLSRGLFGALMFSAFLHAAPVGAQSAQIDDSADPATQVDDAAEARRVFGDKSLTATPDAARPGAGLDGAGAAGSRQLQPTAGRQAVPGLDAVGANPWLSHAPSQLRDEVDWGYWRDQVAADRAVDGAGTGDVVVDEQEPTDQSGANDTLDTAQPIEGVGTGRGEAAQAAISGHLADLPEATPIGPFEEDEGSIPLASEVPLPGDGGLVRTEAAIGDGPHGSAGSGTGDSDFYRFSGLHAGDVLLVDTDTDPAGEATLDTFLTLYDAEGEFVAFADDDGQSFDSFLVATIPADGDYYVSVEDFFSFVIDPFDSASGTGAAGEGPYSVRFGLNPDLDVDNYRVTLDEGDVVSATVAGAGNSIALFDPAGELVMGSTFDASGIYPGATRLTGGGNALLDHVAAAGGTYTLQITGTEGGYDSRLRLLRPGLESARGRNNQQVIFLDFDGEEVNTGIFGGPGVRQLSPLASFLEAWGLSPADEDALIGQIEATVEENLALEGANPRSQVQVLTSRDDRDRFGATNWSRVIVGGTIQESGIPTIGIAQSIDPGNFETEETALVLLDVLSGSPEEFGEDSINSWITDDTEDQVAFIGEALGIVISHEIGHLLGNWHVEHFNETDNIMDQFVLFGAGADGVGGTADDVDIDFGRDIFSLLEGFGGTEDTATRSGYATTTRGWSWLPWRG